MEKVINGVSIIIPAFNEEDNVSVLFAKIKDSMKPYSFPWEAIFVDDGSEDKTFSVLNDLAVHNERLKVIRFKRNFGKGAAYSAGFEKASFQILATMDADLQDDPSEISKFFEKIADGYEYISGWKYKGKGKISKSLPSRVFNLVVRKITGIPIHDFNCPYKVFLKGAVESREVYGELYRFMPVIAASKGYNVTEVRVENYPRIKGQSKYGWERFLRGPFDLLTILFLAIYMKRPLHFFGTVGLIHLILGFSTVCGLYLRKLIWGFPIRDYPFLFVLGVFLMVAAVQIISIGLISDLIIHFKQREAEFFYIDRTVNF